MTGSRPADPAAAPGPPDAEPAPPARTRGPGPRRLRALLIGSVIAAALAVFLFVGLGSSSGGGSEAPAAVGSTAPDFTLPSLNGGTPVQLDGVGRARHHPVVLNFFASWCIPCQQETPLLAQAADTARAHGSTVQFLGVDSLDQKANAVPFVQHAGVTYPVVTDNGRVSSGLYELYGLPQTFFIDADGKVIGHVSGPVKQPQLDRWLHRLAGASA
jgi:cytochrome c biogenesis protein CcmG, thiol:disulfide interchange protein DsbE